VTFPACSSSPTRPPTSSSAPCSSCHGPPTSPPTSLSRATNWGAGYAFEAAAAILRAGAAELADQPVILITQSANTRSRRLADRLGFRFVRTFHAYDAEQTLSAADLHTFLTA